MAIGVGIGVPFKHSGGGGAVANPDFVSTWNVASDGSTITLPLLSGGTYSGTIDWGDSSTSSLSYANRTHTFTTAGTYTITITGVQCQGFQFNNGGDKLKLTGISNFGILDISTVGAFFGCTNIDVTATDAPIISTTSLLDTFRGCSSLTTPDFNAWDVSLVTSFQNFTYTATNFNGFIGDWDTSSATNMSNMFYNTAFNGDIDGWDVSNVTTMLGTFFGTTYSQSLNSWDVTGVLNFTRTFRNATVTANISSWVPSAATNMTSMFHGGSFNGDISGWNVGNVERFLDIFRENSTFNQDIGGWNMSSATTLQNFFYKSSQTLPFDQDVSLWDINQATNLTNLFTGLTGLSTANYDALLIAWAAQGAMSYSGTVNFGGSKYTAGGAAETARTDLIGRWGGITDGGAA